MHGFIDHAVWPAGFFRGRCVALIVIAAAVFALVVPILASAATQTLTVEKAGTGTGTVTSSPFRDQLRCHLLGSLYGRLGGCLESCLWV